MRFGKFGIIAVIKERTCADIVSAIKVLQAYDAVRSYEIRLDALSPEELLVFTESFQVVPHDLRYILTFRSKEAGGEREITHEMRHAFWSSLSANLHALVTSSATQVYADFEIELFDWMEKMGKRAPFPSHKIGVSYHDFLGRASGHELLAILHQMERIPATAFMKIVGTATSDRDGERIFPLFANHKSATPLMAFLMGEAGKETRTLSLLWGGAGTYGYIPGRSIAAAGQYSVAELAENKDVRAALRM